jgi:hypothetical protein
MSTRRFWQIHLSTAVGLMFVAGGLLWLNVKGNYNEGKGMMLGWPMSFPCGTSYFVSLHPFYFALNFIFSIFVLAIFVFVCEWFLRSLEARKP